MSVEKTTGVERDQIQRCTGDAKDSAIVETEREHETLRQHYTRLTETCGNPSILGREKTRADGKSKDLIEETREESVVYVTQSKETNYNSSVTNVHINSCSGPVMIGENNTVTVINNFEHYHGHEKLLMKSFHQMKDVFVETQQYRTARDRFLERHLIILTGTSGDGKSFMAKKLIHEKVQEGYYFKEITSGQDLRALGKCQETVLLLDDAFLRDDPNNQFLITEIEDFVDENSLVDNNNFFIITARTQPFLEVRKRAKLSWLLEDECVILDLLTIELTKSEKRSIIEKHLETFKRLTPTDLEIKSMIDEIIEVDCIGFPNYAYLFVRNDKWFKRGVSFFENSVEIIRKEIEDLKENNPRIYLFLVYLLLKGGQITGSSIDNCLNEENIIKILERIKTYPRNEYITILNQSLQDVEYAYVSRVNDKGTITFRHDRIVEAVCLSLSKILPREAIMNVPFDFIAKRVRTNSYDIYKADLQDMLIISGDRYEDLAQRFLDELKFGNVKAICEHPSINDKTFVNIFIGKLLSASNPESLIQITERAYGSTIDGSLLYWSASCGSESLCEQILQSKIYAKVKDKYWVRIQSSAALVPSCWYGFVFRIIALLVKLGADINSSIHSSRSFQTQSSNYLVVHEPKGWTPIQAVIWGPYINKADYVERLIENGCKFQYKKKMVRPLIHAVKQKDIDLVNVLLKHKVKVDVGDMWGKSPIQFSVELDLIEITELLLKHTKVPLKFVQPRSIEMMMILDKYIDITKKDDDGKSLLHCIEDDKLIDYLLENYKTLSVDMRDASGRTPLYYAKKNNVVQCLLKHKASLSCVDDHTRDTFFHVQQNVEVVQNVLKTLNKEEKSNLLNKKNKAGVTPIFTSRNTFRILLENCADVNIKCSYNPEPDIEIESIYKTKDKQKLLRREIVSNFISKAHSSTVRSKSHTTTQSSESNPNEIESIENFEHQTEDLKRYLATDITVVLVLISMGRLTVETLELALQFGYNFTMKDTNGRNILHHLLTSDKRTKGRDELVKKCLEHAKSNLTGSECLDFINSRDIYGETALSLACGCSNESKIKSERLNIVMTLLFFGADPNITDNSGVQPVNKLMKCRCCLKLEVFKQLVKTKDLEKKYDYTLVVKDLLESCLTLTYPGTMAESVIKDSIEIIEYLLSTSGISLMGIMKYLMDENTDPNITFFILQDQINVLSDDEKQSIIQKCQGKQNANNIICLVILQPLSHFHLSATRLQKLFEFFVQKLQRQFLERTLQSIFDNADIQQLEADLILWTIDYAPGILKTHLLNFLISRGLPFSKTLAIEHCVEMPDDENVTLDCLKILEKHGANLSSISFLIHTLKTRSNCSKVIQYLLENDDIDINEEDKTIRSVVHCFLEFFAKKVNVNVALPLFKILLQKMCIHAANDNLYNVLNVALQCSRLHESFIIEIMERLKEGNCINQKDSEGRPPLQNVLFYYNYERENSELNIVKNIVKLGGKIDWNEVDYKGQNVLHILVSRMKIDTLKILLYILENDKIDAINDKDIDGNSVLHHACMVSTSDYHYYTSLRISVVRVILSKGADVNSVNRKNQTALHLLIQRCNRMNEQPEEKETLLNPIIELIELLLEHKIDKLIKDVDGKAALDYLSDDLVGIRPLVERKAKPEDLIVLHES